MDRPSFHETKERLVADASHVHPLRNGILMDLLPLLSACNLAELKRIDVGLEGDWSPTVRTVWTRTDGRMEFDGAVMEHDSNQPSLELYFSDRWVGLHCFRRTGGTNVLDGAYLDSVIADVEAAISFSGEDI